MATIEELQRQIESLSARLDKLTAPPNDYYTSQYSGEELDGAVRRVIETPGEGPLGGGDVKTVARVSPNEDGNVPLTSADIGAVDANTFYKYSYAEYTSEKINIGNSYIYIWVLAGKLVIINIAFETVSALAKWDQLSVIPEGYRPDGYMNFVLSAVTQNKIMGAYINQDGLFVVTDGADGVEGSVKGYALYPLA